MKPRTFIWLTAVALTVAALGPARAETPITTPWIHIRVEEPAQDSKVAVNLPLSVVQAVLETDPGRIASHGNIHFDCHGHDHHDLSVAEMRRIWKELKATGDAQLIATEERGEKVNVSRKGDLVQVRVDHPSDKETVAVDIPVALVDALLSGEGENLDLAAAVKHLEKLRGDIVRVDDRHSQVRIWVDEKN